MPTSSPPSLCGFKSHIVDARYHRQSIECYAIVPTTLWMPSILAAEEVSEAAAFKDEINYFGDPLVQGMVGVFGVVLLLLVGANVLLGQMDTAIEKVLVDFEATMKSSYPTRWADIREELDGLEGDDRKAKLIDIMEDIQKKDPEFMDRINQKMGK